MLGEDFEQLWLDVFELRTELDIAARHALDDQDLTQDDEMAIARLPDLRRRIDLLTRADLADAEHRALTDLADAIAGCEGRGASYLLAAAPGMPSN